MNARTLVPVLLALSGLVYYPGLTGPFLFDDFGTLSDIGNFGGVDSLKTIALFLAGNDTGSGGRPLALLSFLMNSTQWPADPWPFKLTSLALHLLIGTLLYVLAYQLLHPRMAGDQGSWAALLMAGFWLLNPFNVSTVLYVVQRMAMLSALFVLLGLLAYVHGRQLLPQRRGYLWMTVAIGLFTPLAILSKENGALLPLLALVLEATLLRDLPFTPIQNPALTPTPLPMGEGLIGGATPEGDGLIGGAIPEGELLSCSPEENKTPSCRDSLLFSHWCLVFLWLPSLALLAMLVYFSSPAAFGERDFGLIERLLTEARILWEYLGYWFFPFASPRGVLADGYEVSRGLLSPWTTLPAVVGVVGLIGWALWQRQRFPLVALAILFFFAGHLMESSSLPLELYFEHRNYLPAMLLALPLAVLVVRHSPGGFGERETAPVSAYRLLPVLAILVLCGLAFQTYRLASIWGDELGLSLHWARRNPDSSRAQDFLAINLTQHGRPDLAVTLLEQAIQRNPDNSHFYLHLLWEKCAAGGVTQADLERLGRQFDQHPLTYKSYPLLSNLVEQTPSPLCNGLDVSGLRSLLRGMARHPRTQADSKAYWQLLMMQGVLAIKAGEPAAALSSFGAALAQHPSLSIGMQQVALLASNGHLHDALTWLGRVDQLPRPSDWRGRLRNLDYDAEIARIRRNIEQELQAGSPAHPG